MSEYVILATEVQGFRATAVQVNYYQDREVAHVGTVNFLYGVPIVELATGENGQHITAPDHWKDLIIDSLH